MAITEDIDRELDRFASSDTVRGRLDALRALFTWNIPQARDADPRLEIGTRALLKYAASGEEQLDAIAALGRLVRGVRAISPQLVDALQTILVEPLPPLAGWADAEERLFVARVIDAVRPPWAVMYSADFLASEDGAPKARDALSVLLVELTGSIEGALEAILHWAQPSGDFERDARQVRSILSGLRKTMSLSVEVGAGAAADLAELIARLTPRVDASQSRKLRIETARDVLSFLALTLRGSLAASFQSESYEAFRLIRAWFAPARWPDELKPEIDVVLARLSEALETLVLRGTPDDSLFRVLEAAVGRDGALEVTRRILKERPGAPADVHGWLQSGPGTSRNSAASETAAEASLRKADPAIARSLLSIRALQAEFATGSDEATGQGTLDTVAMTRLGRLVHEAIQSVRVVAATRGLKLLGAPGEIVEFDPHMHRMLAAGVRVAKVRIVQPAVIRQVGEGPAVVVQLATTEPA